MARNTAFAVQQRYFHDKHGEGTVTAVDAIAGVTMAFDGLGAREMYEESRFHRRAKNVSRGHSAITEPAFHGPAARGSAHARLGSQAQTWQKIRNTTMFVKWAIIKLIVQMNLVSTTEMVADIFTKAVDLETHTKMRSMMMNISWTYKGNTAKLTRLVKALNEHRSRVA